jgi:hypothetical protein
LKPHFDLVQGKSDHHADSGILLHGWHCCIRDLPFVPKPAFSFNNPLGRKWCADWPDIGID